jgi:ketosteroid isomerase-like protein
MHNSFLTKLLYSFIILGIFLSAASAHAVTDSASDPHETDRLALRKLLKNVEIAINANQIETLLPYLDDNVVITHQNAHVAKGKDAVVSYNEKMTKGADAPIKKLTTTAKIGGPAYFHGDNMAVGYGTAVDQVELRTGQSFSLDVAWTATLVKKEGTWKAAAIHFSTNVLDNAILRQVKTMALWIGVGILLLSLLTGWIFGRCRTR